MSLLGNLTVSILGNSNGLTDTFRQAESQVKKFGEGMQNVGSNLTTIGSTLSAAITVPLAAISAVSVKAASDFESAFAGVRKTVDTTEEGFANLEKGIREMAKAGPSTASELAAIMEVAGQLGITEKNLLSFTSVMSDLETATNMTAEEAATQLARLANITGMSQGDFDRLGSSIVALGNNFATTEGEIVAMSLRLAGVGSMVGMSESQIAALATAMSSVGIEAEAGGTAMSTVMKKIDVSVADGLKSVKGFAEVAGVSAKEFSDKWKSDPIMALDLFIKGLANSKDEGANLTNMLADLGIKGIRESDTLLRLAGASDLLSEAVKLSGTAWEENTALTNEAAERYKTFESQMDQLKNKFTGMFITIGQVLLPVILDLITQAQPFIDLLASWVQKFSELDSGTQMIIMVLAAVAAAIGPILVVAGLFVSSIGSLITAFAGLGGAVAGAGGMIGLLTGPIGLTVAAVVGLGTALIALWHESETFRDNVTSVFESVKSVAINIFETVASFIGEKVAQIKQFWDENGKQILQAAQNTFNGIKAVIETVMMPAIKLVIETVWKAIQNVIDGALKVITGAIKAFSGLLTGDFSKMWEGVKDIFSGAIELIMGLMTLSFFGGIKTLLTNLAKSGVSLLKGMWDDIAKSFSSMTTNSVNFVKDMASKVISYFANLLSSAKSNFGTLRTFGETTWNALKTVVINAAKNIWDNVVKSFTGLLNSVKTTMTTVKNTISDLWDKAKAVIKPDALLQVGKDVISGLIKGITSMSKAAVESITGVVDGVINKAKDLLGIASPSKLFAQIGRWISEGWAIGIKSTGNKVEDAVSDIALNAKDIAEHYAQEEVKLQNSLKTEIAQIQKRSAEDVAKIQQAAYAKKRKTSEEENIKIRRIQEDADIKIKELKAKTTKEIFDLDSKMYKDILAETQQYISDKKSLDQLSLIDEAQIWQQTMLLFAEGTNERIKAQQEYKKATEAVNKEITAINTDFQNQVNKINEDLIKQEETLTKAYSDAVDKRAQSLVSFKGLFDAFKAEIDVTGEELLTNLGSQVAGFKTWQQEVEKLSEKAIDKGLLEELRQMGPNALPQLLALNQLTDQQLTQYSNLYQEKSALARKQAETELIGMKNDTDKQISELRKAANKELDALKKEWTTKIKDLTRTTSSELSSLKQVGADAGKGLLEGLSSMEDSLTKKAKSIANSIRYAMEDALDIRSPSRVMKQIGQFVGKGLVLGIDSMISSVANVAENLGLAAVPDIPEMQLGAYESFGPSAMKSMDLAHSAIGNSTTTNNNTPISLTLNYNGTGSVQDAEMMLDYIERGLGSRFNNQLRLQGSKG